MAQIEEAITRVIAGPEKKSRVITEKDKRCTAYHEVGHAICAKALPDCDPVHEISIIPRGMAAGYTMTLPEEDSQHVFKSKLLAQLTMMLGGRAAEALVLKDVSTGAFNDLQRASETAKNMVVKFGMSDVIGPVFLGSNQELFLGKEIGHTKTYSEELAAQIDQEVKRILDSAYSNAQEILKGKIDLLHKAAEVLIEREKIDGEEFEKLWNGEDLPPFEVPDLKPTELNEPDSGKKAGDTKLEDSEPENSAGEEPETKE